MKLYHGFYEKRLKKKSRCVAVGIFDGVHRGHQKILKRMLSEAGRSGALSTVVTFEPHPVRVLDPRHAHPIIMSLAHRLRFFERLGVEEAVVIRFDRRFSGTTRETFLEKFLAGRLGMKALSVGYDFRFGRGGAGDTRYLGQEARRLGFRLFVSAPEKTSGRIISSTRIRSLVEAGKLKEAARMLGRPVSVLGTVVRGRGRGRSVGFPTANLNPHHETLPPPGVYAAWGFLDGRKLRGVIHIGKRPTFNDRQKSLEVHFLDFHKQIYNREIELIFMARLRNIQKFTDKKALATAIQNDIQKARRLLS